MNKFSKLINKIDGFYKKAQDSGPTSDHIATMLYQILSDKSIDLNDNAKLMIKQVAINVRDNKADSESINHLIDSLNTGGDKKAFDKTRGLVETLKQFSKKLSGSTSQSSGPDLLASVK